MKPTPERKVSIEDLIRLKRNERPAAEFWVKFDAEIRAKQLSAIVTRPWWDGLARSWAFLGRHQMPVGAAAALALTWIGVRQMENRPVAEHVVKMSMALAAPVAPAAERVPSPAKLEMGPRQEIEAVAAVESAPGKPVVAESTSHLVKAPVTVPTAALSHSPFSEGIAVTLADYRDPAPALARASTFGSDSEFESVSAPARAPLAEPLARMDPSRERRSRLLDSSLPSNPRALVNDWIRSRSSDDRIYESLDHTSDHLLTGIRF